MTLQERIQAYRARFDLTDDQMAEHLGLTRARYDAVISDGATRHDSQLIRTHLSVPAIPSLLTGATLRGPSRHRNEIDPEVRPADWADLLSLDIGHRIKHDLTPGGVGSSIELELHLEHIAHTITPERWTITLNGSPVDPHEAAYFLWAVTETVDTDNGWGDPSGTPPGGYWG